MTKDAQKIILFTIPDFRGGGAERVFLNLINNLNRDKFVIHIAVGELQGEYCKYLSNDITIHKLGSTHSIESVIPMIKLVRNIKPNVVFATLGYVVTISISSLFFSKKIKIISRFGNTISAFLGDIKKGSRGKYFFQFLLNKLVINLSDVVVVQSGHMRDDLIQTFSLSSKLVIKVIKINNPIDINNLYNNINTLSLSSDVQKFIDSKQYIFVSVGRLSDQKNYKDLICAFSIANRDNNIGLVILGEGVCRIKLEELICKLEMQKNILMPGFIDNPELILSSADCFVSSSLYEGMSNAMLEALSLGVPVIATNCPSGIREVVIDGRNGFLVDIDQNFVKNLSGLILAMPTESHKIDSNEIRKSIKRSFDIKKITREYEEIFW